MREDRTRPLIAVVGPCAAGKSTLVRELRRRGYNAREVVQEHSYVAAMWQRLTQPDLLIYLDVSWEAACRRRPTTMPGGADLWEEQSRRLDHARRHADLYLDTDDLTPQEVLDRVWVFIEANGRMDECTNGRMNEWTNEGG